jgi:response regulator of citrate/malate metabolism
LDSVIRERDFLIIEDSAAVSLLLKEYLKKLGIEKIQSFENGKKGIAAFKKLVKTKNDPVVFLDYNLPDMNGFSVMTQLIKVKPDVKVIIETALDRSEQSIKDVIAQGAYQYLAKPIRFEQIKEIIQTIEKEQSLLEKNNENISEEVIHMIDRNTQISFAKISEFLNIGKEDFLPIISKLKSENKVMQVSDIKEIACHNCGSIKITQVFHCPACNGSNFKQENLIEHYNCGNVSPEISYNDDMCPKCRDKIKILGADYKILKNFYTCNECNEKFQEIATKFYCLKCNNQFNMEDAKRKTSYGYRVVT